LAVSNPIPSPRLHSRTKYSPVGIFEFQGSMSDASGNGNNLTVANGTERYAPIGGGPLQGFEFRDDTMIETGTSATELQITGDITIACLVKWIRYGPGISQNDAVMLGHGESGESEAVNIIYGVRYTGVASGGLEWLHETGSGSNQQYSMVTEVPAYKLFHFVARRDADAGGDTIEFFLDGVQAGPAGTGLTTATGGTSGRFYVGGEVNGSLYSRMVVASLNIYDAALTDAQIADLYRMTMGG